jgi:hypothetical protein
LEVRWKTYQKKWSCQRCGFSSPFWVGCERWRYRSHCQKEQDRIDAEARRAEVKGARDLAEIEAAIRAENKNFSQSEEETEMDIQPQNQLPSWFQATAVGRQLIAENGALETRQRQEVVDQMAGIRFPTNDALPRLRKDAEAAFEEEQAGAAVLEAARDKRMKTRWEVTLDLSLDHKTKYHSSR